MESNIAKYENIIVVDTLRSRHFRDRRHIAFVNDAYSSDEEPETDGSSTTSGYCSRASSPSDLSDADDGGIEVAYESTKPLVHTLEYILCVKEMCDVTFLAGKMKEPVYGLQAVMGSRSRYFYQLFLSHRKTHARKSSEFKRGFFSVFKKKSKKTGPEATGACGTGDNHITIPVPDYDHDVFRKVVTFVHLGQVAMTTDTVIGLICASTEYQLEDLRQACWEFVARCTTPETLPELLKSSALYRTRPHVKPFLHMISRIRKKS